MHHDHAGRGHDDLAAVPVLGTGNIPIASGNNVQIPVNIGGAAVAILGFSNASGQGGAAAFLDSFNS